MKTQIFTLLFGMLFLSLSGADYIHSVMNKEADKGEPIKVSWVQTGLKSVKLTVRISRDSYEVLGSPDSIVYSFSDFSSFHKGLSSFAYDLKNNEYYIVSTMMTVNFGDFFLNSLCLRQGDIIELDNCLNVTLATTKWGDDPSPEEVFYFKPLPDDLYIGEPVDVSWTLNSECGISAKNYCAEIIVRMSKSSYEVLGRPNQGIFYYLVYGPWMIKYQSQTAPFSYDQQADEYYFIALAGVSFEIPIPSAFALDKLCLRKGDSQESDNCVSRRINTTSRNTNRVHYFKPKAGIESW